MFVEIQRYRLGKVLDALHGRIDRPTPKRHCIDKFEESHEVQGGLEREHGPRTQHWILQLQKNLENSSIMSNRGTMRFLYTSGEPNGQLGVDHEVQGGPEREHGPRKQHWVLQLQKNPENPSTKSSKIATFLPR